MRSWLWLTMLCAAPALAGGESLPASIRACAAETDSLKRLVCYDREVARYPEDKPTGSKPTAKREPTPTPSNEGTAGASTSAAMSTAAAPPPPASPPQQPEQSAGHVSAHVVSIEHIPNEMVLHLDNGQSWQEVQSVPGDLSLQVGDTVKIDKRLGSYWLTGPHVSGMKVRQKS
jgi:hypothetical protein